jgi:hypothetical protein
MTQYYTWHHIDCKISNIASSCETSRRTNRYYRPRYLEHTPIFPDFYQRTINTLALLTSRVIKINRHHSRAWGFIGVQQALSFLLESRDNVYKSFNSRRALDGKCCRVSAQSPDGIQNVQQTLRAFESWTKQSRSTPNWGIITPKLYACLAKKSELTHHFASYLHLIRTLFVTLSQVRS